MSFPIYRGSHPAFKDESGKVLAGCTVVRRAESVNGNGRWHVLAACGHEMIATGIQLRAYEKAGGVLRCPPCRPKRAGTVRRRG